MDLSAVIHSSKSRYSYAYDEKTLHVRIKTKIGDVTSIKVKAVDPFNWSQKENGKYEFDAHLIQTDDMVLEGQTKTHDVWFAVINGIETLRIRYSFLMTTSEGKHILYGCDSVENIDENPEKLENVFNYFNFPYINNEDVYKAPSWVKDAIWYQLTPSSFSKDGETCEDNTSGNFNGLLEKLDHIEEMGYTALYFTPIFEAYTWHLYDTTDYFKVAAQLGGNEQLRAFIEEAHKRGIKIMLDAVFNHCGPQHPFWQDVLKNGKESEYYDCFYIIDESKPILDTEILADGSYEDKGSYDNNFRTFAYSTRMPKLNTSNPIMREYLLHVAKYWVEEFGIDGWRLDVSNEVSHDFWRAFRKTVKAVNPEVYIMGENWDDSYEWLRGDQFDSVMNYGFMNAANGYIAPDNGKYPKLKASEFKTFLTDLITRYPVNVTENFFNLLSSHDVDRLLTACGDNKALFKLCYVIAFTYSGAPCVYFGDEFGMSGDVEESRIPMIWDSSQQDLELKDFIKALIKMRKEHDALKAVAFRWLMVDDETNTVIYSKENANESVYVLIHNQAKTEVIQLPEELQNREFTNIYDNSMVKLKEWIELKPYEYIIIR